MVLHTLPKSIRSIESDLTYCYGATIRYRGGGGGGGDLGFLPGHLTREIESFLSPQEISGWKYLLNYLFPPCIVAIYSFHPFSPQKL